MVQELRRMLCARNWTQASEPGNQRPSGSMSGWALSWIQVSFYHGAVIHILPAHFSHNFNM